MRQHEKGREARGGVARRGFLAAIAGAFVAPDPERLLWTPGKKLISIPAAPRVLHLSCEEFFSRGKLGMFSAGEVFVVHGYAGHFRVPPELSKVRLAHHWLALGLRCMARNVRSKQ